MNGTDNNSRRTSLGRIALAAMLTVTLAAAAQCGGGAQACAAHGGLRVQAGGIYYCNDGTNHGAGAS